MENQSGAPKKSPVSTPKKIALAVLGALTLLTFVNIIQGAVDKHKNQTEDVVVEDIIAENEIRIVRNGEVIVRTNKTQHKSEAGEVMVDETFKVSNGENLSVSVGDADIDVETSESNEARIQVLLDGSDMDKARAYFEDQNFEISRDGKTIHVVTRPERRNYSWNRTGNAGIQVHINIPESFNVSLKTSDGDIRLGRLNGETSIHTSDGDIITDAIMGPAISIRTSDGDISTALLDAREVSVTTSDGDIDLNDIRAENISIRTSDGDIRGNHLTGISSVSTSDGDIIITTLEGEKVAVRTSDGEINTDRVDALESQFQTSDGSILLKSVSGALTAKTSSGNLDVTLGDVEKAYLRTGDGDIYIRAPHDYSAALYLKGERVRVSSGFQFDGKLKEDEAEGRINGGGRSIEARTSDGEVVFREN